MKKLIIGTLLFLLVYSIYFDLKVGTLPTATTIKAIETPVAEARNKSLNPYKTVTVQPGETVLTILERIHTGNMPVSINKAVEDFEALNNSISAHAIQANESYRFPLYR
ncbi:hypothetical protein [Pseudalkalibacillus decolorationis]|uniref:hypothetical protein n=1 Tax=Pseudalkalibacillus decolorationis TaxID=163879 RepID=UPI002147DD34|nr:hypothetical protein [Pseudalkalibacillus decolorationis]